MTRQRWLPVFHPGTTCVSSDKSGLCRCINQSRPTLLLFLTRVQIPISVMKWFLQTVIIEDDNIRYRHFTVVAFSGRVTLLPPFHRPPYMLCQDQSCLIHIFIAVAGWADGRAFKSALLYLKLLAGIVLLVIFVLPLPVLRPKNIQVKQSF